MHENTQGNFEDWCHDHEFVIALPIDYDHGCIPIGWRDHWHHSATLGYDHGHRDRDHGGHTFGNDVLMKVIFCEYRVLVGA